MEIQYHYRGQKPFRYRVDDDKFETSTLSVAIEDLYPPDFVDKHGRNARNVFTSLSNAEKYPHLWYCQESKSDSKRKVDDRSGEDVICLTCRQ